MFSLDEADYKFNHIILYLIIKWMFWGLSDDPDYFPVNDYAYPPLSNRSTLTHLIFISYLVFRVCLDLVLLSHPTPK